MGTMGEAYILDIMARRVQTDGLYMDRARAIVDELFLTRPIESRDARSRDRNEEDEVGDDGCCRITLKDLRDACTKINPKKAVGVDGIAGTMA